MKSEAILGADVLEVGPGYGATTDVLSRAVPRLISVEIDDELKAHGWAVIARADELTSQKVCERRGLPAPTCDSGSTRSRDNAQEHPMTTSDDTEMAASYDTEMATIFGADPDTHTIATAWSSSPLGQPERDVPYGSVSTGPTEAVSAPDGSTPVAERAPLAAALLAGIGTAAALGVVLFGYADPGQSTVVVPGAEPGSPEHAVVVTPQSPAAAAIRDRRAPAANQADPAPAPKPVVSVPKPAPAAVPAPKGPVDPGTPPASHPPVIVDIDIPPLPPLPEKPEPPDPEPPKPPPADVDDFQIPQLPPEPPDPQPVDDLAPKPAPKPKPDPPELGPALPATVFAP